MGGIFSAAEVAEVEEQLNAFVKNEQPQHGKKRDPLDVRGNAVISEVPNIPEDEVRDDPNSIELGEELSKHLQSSQVEGSKTEIKDYRERMDEFYASLNKVQQLVAQLKGVKDDTEREKLLAVLRKEKQILLEKKRSGYFMMYKTPTANDQTGFPEAVPEAQQHLHDANLPNILSDTTRQKSNSTSSSQIKPAASGNNVEPAQAGSQQSEKEQILEVFGVVDSSAVPSHAVKQNQNNNNTPTTILSRRASSSSKKAVLSNWRNPLHILNGMQPHV